MAAKKAAGNTRNLTKQQRAATYSPKIKTSSSPDRLKGTMASDKATVTNSSPYSLKNVEIIELEPEPPQDTLRATSPPPAFDSTNAVLDITTTTSEAEQCKANSSSLVTQTTSHTEADAETRVGATVSHDDGTASGSKTKLAVRKATATKAELIRLHLARLELQEAGAAAEKKVIEDRQKAAVIKRKMETNANNSLVTSKQPRRKKDPKRHIPVVAQPSQKPKTPAQLRKERREAKKSEEVASEDESTDDDSIPTISSVSSTQGSEDEVATPTAAQQTEDGSADDETVPSITSGSPTHDIEEEVAEHTAAQHSEYKSIDDESPSPMTSISSTQDNEEEIDTPTAAQQPQDDVADDDSLPSMPSVSFTQDLNEEFVTTTTLQEPEDECIHDKSFPLMSSVSSTQHIEEPIISTTVHQPKEGELIPVADNDVDMLDVDDLAVATTEDLDSEPQLADVESLSSTDTCVAVREGPQLDPRDVEIEVKHDLSQDQTLSSSKASEVFLMLLSLPDRAEFTHPLSLARCEELVSMHVPPLLPITTVTKKSKVSRDVAINLEHDLSRDQSSGSSKASEVFLMLLSLPNRAKFTHALTPARCEALVSLHVSPLVPTALVSKKRKQKVITEQKALLEDADQQEYTKEEPFHEEAIDEELIPEEPIREEPIQQGRDFEDPALEDKDQKEPVENHSSSEDSPPDLSNNAADADAEGVPSSRSLKKPSAETNSQHSIVTAWLAQVPSRSNTPDLQIDQHLFIARNTYIGDISQEDLINSLQVTEEGVTSYQDVCTTFARLAALDAEALGFSMPALGSEEELLEFRRQARVKINTVTLRRFLKEIPFDGENKTTVVLVAEAFSSLAEERPTLLEA